jgi:cell division protein FtsW
MTTNLRIASPRWSRRPNPPLFAHAPAKRRELPVDKLMLATVVGLTLFGVVMVYSASAILAERSYGSQYYFLIKQSIWATVGLAAMAIAMRVDYRRYNRLAVVGLLVITTVLLLSAVLFLPAINRTHRWIRFGAYLSIQPSEFSKLALAAFLAYFLEARSEELRDFKRTFFPLVVVAGLIIALVALEPDLGTAIALGLVFVTVVFEAGVRVRYLLLLALPVVPGLGYMLLFVGWRLQRLLDFMDPWQNQTTSSFQVVQSLIAIGSGGTSGMGFAQGKQKLFYLPAPHTDFIFAVIGEELGLIGAATVVLLFGLMAWRGFRAARFAPDLFGRLLAVGLTVMITAQAFFNISVALSLLPTKGIPLPFVSSGGSSLAISLFAAGVLLNISKHAKE